MRRRYTWFSYYDITTAESKELLRLAGLPENEPLVRLAVNEVGNGLEDVLYLSMTRNLSYEKTDALVWIPIKNDDFYGHRRYALYLFKLFLKCKDTLIQATQISPIHSPEYVIEKAGEGSEDTQRKYATVAATIRLDEKQRYEVAMLTNQCGREEAQRESSKIVISARGEEHVIKQMKAIASLFPPEKDVVLFDRKEMERVWKKPKRSPSEARENGKKERLQVAVERRANSEKIENRAIKKK